jgi:uncharacterized 2Fe-2S/4Fe-4S cluster protein (DUF4445 family)
MLIDVGTNGEIVLSKDGKLWAASTAAGPAFEGARISCGMRAIHGAVEKVVFDEDVHCSTIGGASPVGICGSGLIDLAAELLNSGVLATNGRLLYGDELPARLTDVIKRRVRKNKNGQVEFLIYKPQKGQQGPSITITQQDIRELQLALGAMRAGIEIMLHKTNIKIEDVQKVFVAGGFGYFIRRANAQKIGLLPTKLPHNRISFIGNSSLDGARLALLSTDARSKAEQIAGKTSHVQLSLDHEFQTTFVDAMIFPD